MYAVIRTGGKQLRVAKDDVIRVEKLAAEDGAEITLDDVLMLGDGSDTTIGTPLVEGASVSATVLEQTRGDKIIVFKKKRRKNYRRRKGHRQDLTVLRIDAISPPGSQKAAKKAAAKPAAKTAKSDAEAAPKAALPFICINKDCPAGGVAARSLSETVIKYEMDGSAGTYPVQKILMYIKSLWVQ